MIWRPRRTPQSWWLPSYWMETISPPERLDTPVAPVTRSMATQPKHLPSSPATTTGGAQPYGLDYVVRPNKNTNTHTHTYTHIHTYVYINI